MSNCDWRYVTTNAYLHSLYDTKAMSGPLEDLYNYNTRAEQKGEAPSLLNGNTRSAATSTG